MRPYPQNRPVNSGTPKAPPFLRRVLTFRTEQPYHRGFSRGDAAVLLIVAVLIYGGIRLALRAPETVEGPAISLSPSALPYYTFRSVGRMAAAYALSLLFTLVYGRLAAYNRHAERILLPLLDVLQSVPILSFLPVVLLSLSAILPERIAAELASIVLIFTSQVWNMTFAWYQSLTTIPKELQEASAIFRFNTWLRFKVLELPFAAISLLWNSMMSWAGGWFFLMAAEIFTVGERDFRLPGLGAFLQEAANQGDTRAILWGIGTLVLVIVALDQLVWRPLLAWADRFKLEMVEGENPPTSWFYDLLRNSRLLGWFSEKIWQPLNERVDAWLIGRAAMPEAAEGKTGRPYLLYALGIAFGLGLAYGGFRAAMMLFTMPPEQWGEIGLGILATFLRVSASLLIALAWTIPAGVIIGTNRRAATILQPIVQIVASVPATALFPVLLLVIVGLPGGLDFAAILLMLMGTQWYLLFNIIAGASAIPQDLKYTSALIGLSRWERWRTLILPSLFPYIITGSITASGGAWNASIVAEHVEFGGRTLYTTGIGALISRATAAGDYPLLLAATLTMILTVVLINRTFWRRLYRLAEEKYRME
ncbi:MAG: ABC transporter permease subunit [Anaerolineae bacterium]|nr:ABC transporter permease subunit [Anaerolineae bacterium]MCX8067674.1 ABC transporter permease subunit [Anaerolineae bacterium]MDW7990798.1 ABC transporter permease subunit [Anaerolineae bacterium]